MRLVVDADIIFSALYNMDSTAGQLLFLAIDGQVQLFSTEHVKEEMRAILVTKLGYSKDEVGELIGSLPVEWMDGGVYLEELDEASKILDNEADASLLAVAIVLGCDVVTGDKKILAAKFRKVNVRRLREFKSP